MTAELYDFPPHRQIKNPSSEKKYSSVFCSYALCPLPLSTSHERRAANFTPRLSASLRNRSRRSGAFLTESGFRRSRYPEYLAPRPVLGFTAAHLYWRHQSLILSYLRSLSPRGSLLWPNSRGLHPMPRNTQHGTQINQFSNSL